MSTVAQTEKQGKRRFFNEANKPSEEELTRYFSRSNKACPLNKVIVSKANEGNFRILNRFAMAALRDPFHSCRGFNFAIYSPPGQGKTFIVKKWAETIGIPFVFIQSSSIKSNYHLFVQIKKECEKSGTPIVPHKTAKSDFTLPPAIVLFDEAHEMNSEMQRAGLLNPMEPDDGIMTVIEPGQNGETFLVDCRNICWIAATTDPADLFDAFRSRFLNQIEWAPATSDELPPIIKAGLDEKLRSGLLNMTPPMEICQLIAKYQSVPRPAIHSFGTQVVLQKQSEPSMSWENCCKMVAVDLGIDDEGFTKRQIMILQALGQRPVAKARLGDICQCRTAQIESMELPGLVQYSNGGPFCLSVSGKGMCITEAGLRKLDSRGIKHNGKKVTAEFFESKR